VPPPFAHYKESAGENYCSERLVTNEHLAKTAGVEAFLSVSTQLRGIITNLTPGSRGPGENLARVSRLWPYTLHSVAGAPIRPNRKWSSGSRSRSRDRHKVPRLKSQFSGSPPPCSSFPTLLDQQGRFIAPSRPQPWKSMAKVAQLYTVERSPQFPKPVHPAETLCSLNEDVLHVTI